MREFESGTGAVCAVVVIYYPDIDILKRLIAALLPQVACVVLVNNSPEKGEINKFVKKNPGVICFAHDKNLGVAAGQNTGIRWAEKQSFSHVMLFDQDSFPAENFVQELLAAENKLRDQGLKVGAVAPLVIDSSSEKAEFFLSQGTGWVTKKYCNPRKNDETLHVDYAISSGCLISLKTLKAVGLMDESLFIDLVDVEWCYRALGMGFSTFVVCEAKMHHTVGLKKENGYWGPLKRITSHSPERLYYQCRNFLLLARKRYVPTRWLTYHFFRHLIPRCIIFSIIAGPRIINAGMILKGFRHGLKDVSGPLSDCI